MYFDLIPNIQYNIKPSQFSFSENDFVIAKNFFRRYEIPEELFSYSVYFNKYTIQDSDRLDLISENYYGDPFYDWVIILTNNMINSVYDWPLTNEEFNQKMESMIINPYTTTKHYKTKEVKSGYTFDGIEVVALKEGLIVDETFVNSNFRYWNGSSQVSIPGSEITTRVTVYEYEQELNNSKREIYILKKRYLESFIKDFRRSNQYTESSQFVSDRLKRSGS